ncbi:hypothetical protein [uncultured Clostridium sp.]|nr:hypothetical protein [uncultured Clostridium sp.]
MIWSKLQKQLYLIIDKESKFQIHCSVYKTKSAWNAGQRSGISKKQESIPRYWITVGDNKEIIWDFPNNFLDERSIAIDKSEWLSEKYDTIKDTYFWDCNYTWVANLIREYLDTPRDQILIKEFENDKYGLIDILRKYDKRISKTKRDNIKI